MADESLSLISQILRQLRGTQAPQQSQQMNQIPMENPAQGQVMLNPTLEQQALAQGQYALPAGIKPIVNQSGLLSFLRNLSNQKVTDIQGIDGL